MPSRSPSDVIKPEVRAAAAYTLKHVQADVKLDQNENPFELPPEFKNEVAQRVLARSWGRYPEFVPSAITKTLADVTGWSEDGILVGNGSNELIQAGMAVMLGPGRRVVIPQPSFTLYRLQASVLQAEIVTVPLKAPDFAFDVDALAEASRDAELTVISSPNNPTGSLLDHDGLAHVLAGARGIVMLDEAYHEFSGQTALTLLPAHKNLVVLRTLSKAMSMAGLRFGYMLAHPEIAREVHKGKLPYNVNIFTLTAAQLVLERAEMLKRPLEILVQERQRLYDALQERPGIEVFPSQANFMLFRTEKPTHIVFDALYEQGILVRDVSSYPMLDRALRVTIGKPEENDRFLAALDRILEKG